MTEQEADKIMQAGLQAEPRIVNPGPGVSADWGIHAEMLSDNPEADALFDAYVAQLVLKDDPDGSARESTNPKT